MTRTPPGPSCPWPLRCLKSNDPCSMRSDKTLGNMIAYFCNCQHCTAFKAAYPRGLRR